METGKHYLTSKTLWAAVTLMAAQVLLPSAKPWIKENSAELIPMLGVLFAGLRFLTDKPIRLWRRK